MEGNNKSLETEIHKVFKLFSNEKYEEGKNVLLELYENDYKYIEDIKTKRLLLSNLAWVEYQLDDKDNAKKHIEIIKKAIAEDTKYMFDDPVGYSRVLNLYCELFKDKISKEYYINYNMLIAYFAKDAGNFPDEAMALANVYWVSNQEDKVVSLIKKLLEGDSPQHKYCINSLLRDLKKADITSYEKALKLVNGGM